MTRAMTTEELDIKAKVSFKLGKNMEKQISLNYQRTFNNQQDMSRKNLNRSKSVAGPYMVTNSGRTSNLKLHAVHSGSTNLTP